ncbi:MAG: hypothetical protein RSD48_03795, partial [Oscillospiraceae bacterium]
KILRFAQNDRDGGQGQDGDRTGVKDRSGNSIEVKFKIREQVKCADKKIGSLFGGTQNPRSYLVGR